MTQTTILPTESRVLAKPMYGGDVTLYFDPEQHIYSLDENLESRVYGVTSIVKVIDKPFLVQWAVDTALTYIKKVGEDCSLRNVDAQLAFAEVMRSLDEAKYLHRGRGMEAARKGSEAHKWVENHIKGIKQALPKDQDVKNSCFAYLQFVDRYKPKFILSEEMVLSKKHSYAGTLDFTAKIDGELVLGDFKTSRDVYDTHFLETAARIKARREEFPSEKYKKMVLVRLGKDGQLKVKESTEIDRYYKAFMAALTLTRSLKEKV